MMKHIIDRYGRRLELINSAEVWLRLLKYDPKLYQSLTPRLSPLELIRLESLLPEGMSKSQKQNMFREILLTWNMNRWFAAALVVPNKLTRLLSEYHLYYGSVKRFWWRRRFAIAKFLRSDRPGKIAEKYKIPSNILMFHPGPVSAIKDIENYRKLFIDTSNMQDVGLLALLERLGTYSRQASASAINIATSLQGFRDSKKVIVEIKLDKFSRYLTLGTMFREWADIAVKDLASTGVNAELGGVQTLKDRIAEKISQAVVRAYDWEAVLLVSDLKSKLLPEIPRNQVILVSRYRRTALPYLHFDGLLGLGSYELRAVADIYGASL